ncbi:hypothetical protein BH20ACI4_BH20ACI4_28340 [soil metagenome]
MKRKLSIFSALALVLTLFVSLTITPVKADTPTISITGPSGTVFVPGFPYNTTIDFTISHADLNDLNALRVDIDGNQLHNFGNPFSTTACNSGGGNLAGVATLCSVAAGTATVKIPWSVPGPGTYTISVSVKHNGAEGEEVETATFVLTAIEYPAPPAVANAYLNTFTPKVNAKKRGCVISQIANNHAQNSKYGPKGGPYDETLIRSDTDLYLAGCQ